MCPSVDDDLTIFAGRLCHFRHRFFNFFLWVKLWNAVHVPPLPLSRIDNKSIYYIYSVIISSDIHSNVQNELEYCCLGRVHIQTCYKSKLLIFINIMERECIFGLFILSMVNTVQ